MRTNLEDNSDQQTGWARQIRKASERLRQMDKEKLGKTIARAGVRLCCQKVLTVGVGLILTATGLPDISSFFDSKS